MMEEPLQNKTHTVAVAMSGGVDSSVAAALLKEQGHRVIGLTMLLWPEEIAGAQEACCGTAHLADARAVCDLIGIRHYTLDLRREFLGEVVEPFRSAYLDGRTPNPCILCNRHMKFDHLLRKAMAIGADRLATGHYARVTGAGPHGLSRGLDPAKDQSYFLFPVDQRILSRLVLPLGEMTKSQVRAKAARLGLPVARKAESQEICFVPAGGLRGFIGGPGRSPIGAGPIVDTSGKVLGTHPGAIYFTVGQRKGLGVAAKEPLYVVGIDVGSNTVVIGTRAEASSTALTAGGASWVHGSPPSSRFHAVVQIRHRHRPAAAEVEASIDHFTVRFDQPQLGVAPGQAAVLYDGDDVTGGGWIEGGEHNKT